MHYGLCPGEPAVPIIAYFRRQLGKLNKPKTVIQDIWAKVEKPIKAVNEIREFALGINSLVISIYQNVFFAKIVKFVFDITLHAQSTEKNEYLFAAKKIVRVVKLTAIVMAPLYIIDIGKKTFYILTGRADRIQSALEIIGRVGDIITKVASFSEGLVVVGLVTARSVSFAAPLAIVGEFFEIASLINSTRNLYLNIRFQKAFKSVFAFELDGSISDENFERAINFLTKQKAIDKREYRKNLIKLDKHFDTDSKNLNATLIKINENKDQLSKEEKTEIIKTLKGRITAQNRTYALEVLSSTIHIVSTTVFAAALFVCPAVLPIGFALLTTAFGVSFAGAGINTVSQYLFNRSIKSFDEKIIPNDE